MTLTKPSGRGWMAGFGRQLDRALREPDEHRARELGGLARRRQQLARPARRSASAPAAALTARWWWRARARAPRARVRAPRPARAAARARAGRPRRGSGRARRTASARSRTAPMRARRRRPGGSVSGRPSSSQRATLGREPHRGRAGVVAERAVDARGQALAPLERLVRARRASRMRSTRNVRSPSRVRSQVSQYQSPRTPRR